MSNNSFFVEFPTVRLKWSVGWFVGTPVCLSLTAQSLPRCVPPRCDGSLRADRGRWSESVRGCSWGSTLFYFGCSPAPCWPGNAGQHWWPGWRTNSCGWAGRGQQKVSQYTLTGGDILYFYCSLNILIFIYHTLQNIVCQQHIQGSRRSTTIRPLYKQRSKVKCVSLFLVRSLISLIHI